MRVGIVLKRAGLGLAVLVVAAATLVFFASEKRLDRRYEFTAFSGVLPHDEASIAEGRRLSGAYGCADCHTANLAGQVMVSDPAFGTVAATNLTLHARDSDAALLAWLDAGMRHGVNAQSRSLVMMPSAEYAQLSDREVLAIAAYLSSLEPTTNELPQRKLGPVGRALLVAEQLHDFLPAELIDHTRAAPSEPPATGTIAHGEHLAALCRGCHGPQLTGAQPAAPGSPHSANLTSHASGLAAWSEADFITALRTGRTPDGRDLNPQFMPWKATANASDEELSDLWAYLRSLEAKHKT